MSKSNQLFQDTFDEYEQFINEEQFFHRDESKEEDYEQAVSEDSVSTESPEGANE